MDYSEHIQRNRAREREVYARLDEEGRHAAWFRRQIYLWGAFDETFLKPTVGGCPACTPGYRIRIESWPQYFECSLCGVLICIDKCSHLLPDEIERVSTITRQALDDLKGLGLLKMDYPIEERLKDLRAGSIADDIVAKDDEIFLRACGIQPFDTVLMPEWRKPEGWDG